MLKSRDSWTRYKFLAIYILYGLCIQICLDLCDPKKSRPVVVCEVCRVGRCGILIRKTPWGWQLGAETCRRLIFVINFILLSASLDWPICNTRGIPRALEAKHEKSNTYIDYVGHTHCPAIYEQKSQTTNISLRSVPLLTERLYSPTYNTINTLNERVVHLGIIISV